MKENFNSDTEISVIFESWFEILARRKRELQFKLKKTKSMPRFIAVYGGAAVEKGSPRWIEAYKTGVELAKRGAIVYNGGYGGVMEASAAGARSVGGTTIGVTCNNLPVDAVNPEIQYEWKVNRWDQRLLALVWLADGYAVMQGSSGTLVELSMVVETQFKGFIPARPIVCMRDYWKPVVERIVGTDGMVYFTDEPKELADILFEK